MSEKIEISVALMGADSDAFLTDDLGLCLYSVPTEATTESDQYTTMTECAKALRVLAVKFDEAAVGKTGRDAA